jgi:hypothetical protein
MATGLPPFNFELTFPEGVTSERADSGEFARTASPASKAVWEEYLPKALASGQFVPAPEVEVVGKDLEAIKGGAGGMGEGRQCENCSVCLCEGVTSALVIARPGLSLANARSFRPILKLYKFHTGVMSDWFLSSTKMI